MIYLLEGEDQWRLEEFARDLQKQAKDAGASIQVFEAPGDFESALLFLWQSSLFEEARLALIKKSETLSENFKPLWRKFSGASDLPVNRTLVFVSIGKAPAWLKKLAAKAVDFPFLRGRALEDWLEQRATALGLKLEPAVAEFFSSYFAGDSGRIAQELAKLADWKPGGRITVADLRILADFEASQPELFFGLTDAIFARNRKQALSRLAHNLARGGEPVQLLATLANTFRTMLVLKATPSADSRKLLGQAKPFWLSKIRQAGRNFSSDEIKKTLASILRADYLIKTGRQPADQALEEIVLEIT